MGFRKVLAVGALALEEIRHSIGAEAIDAQLKPEAGNLDHFVLYRGIVVIQVWLAGVKAVPVILTCHFVPAPIGWLRVEKDDARFFVLLVRIAPYVVVAIRRAPGGARGLEPRMLIGRVIQ